MLTPISDDKMRQLLEGISRERSNLEFKPPFKWGVPPPTSGREPNVYNQLCVIKGVIGLSHHNLGGTLIVGVDEDENHAPIYTGLETAQLASFQDVEAIHAVIQGYASEAVNLEIGTGKWPNNAGEPVDLVVFSVEQFSGYASSCTKDSPMGVMKKGLIYVRPTRGQPRTEHVGMQEFRELQDMATDNIQRNLEGRNWVWNTAADPARATRNADLESDDE